MRLYLVISIDKKMEKSKLISLGCTKKGVIRNRNSELRVED